METLEIMNEDEIKLSDLNGEEKIRRWSKYSRLGPKTRELIKSLYGSLEEYLSVEFAHPFEEYILAYDEQLGDDEVVWALSRRMGFFLEYDYDDDAPINIFPILLGYVIEKMHDLQVSSDYVEKIMNLTLKQFLELGRKLGENLSEYEYVHRLNYLFDKVGKLRDINF